MQVKSRGHQSGRRLGHQEAERGQGLRGRQEEDGGGGGGATVAQRGRGAIGGRFSRGRILLDSTEGGMGDSR
jgi:hypothetical protein